MLEYYSSLRKENERSNCVVPGATVQYRSTNAALATHSRQCSCRRPAPGTNALVQAMAGVSGFAWLDCSRMQVSTIVHSTLYGIRPKSN